MLKRQPCMFNVNMSGKRLFICTVGLPHQSRGASVVLFFHYIKKFKEEGFNILHLVIVPEGKVSDEALSQYCGQMQEEGVFQVSVFKVKRFYHLSRLAMNFILSDKIIAQIKDFNPELVFCFDIPAAATISKYVSCPKAVWLGDLKFQTTMYHALYAAKENFMRFINVPWVWLFCRMVKYFYKQVLSKFNLVVVAAKSSETILRKLGIEAIYLPYPWPAAPAVNTGPRYPLPSFLFFGALGALGSRSALHFLVDEIYPELINLWKPSGFQIFICGSHPLPRWVEKQLSQKSEIKYLGFVDDLGVLMAQCHAVIAPIDVPVGNRSRIVTALAGGALVIAHKNTSLGNPDLKDGETCYLADRREEFIKYMKLAYEFPDLTDTIVKVARAGYDRSFHPAAAGEKIIKEIKGIFNGNE